MLRRDHAVPPRASERGWARAVTRTILHVLPHRGGGAETYIDLLEPIEGVRDERVALSAGRSAAAGAASIAARYPLVAARALRADVVHAHGDAAAAIALPLLSRLPSVWTTHGLHLVRRADGRSLAAMRSALRRAIAGTARTICTSQAERDELLALWAPHAAPAGMAERDELLAKWEPPHATPAGIVERIVVVRNGIEPPALASALERATVRECLGLGEGDLAVLFLGELDQRKRPLDAVAAVQRLAAAGAPVVLLVAGDGPQSAEVRARAGDGVRALGRRDDVPALLAAADALVMPSEREGLSFAVLEAMGAGLALVVSDGAGNPEAVGDAGIVVAVGDVDGLAAALAGLAADRAQVRRLGEAARHRVLTEFTAESLRSGVEAAYTAALASA